MNCISSKKFVDAYLDGELEAGMMLEIETHLESCEECAGVLCLKRDMKTELAKRGNAAAPEHLRRQIEMISSGSPRVWWQRPVVAAPVAAAAAFMLLMWSHSTPQTTLPKDEVALLVQDVVDRHVRELPMEIQNANQNTAASWFQGKIDFPVRPLGTGIRNATFQGARVSNVRENQAAQMVYRVDGKKVTFMVFPANQLAIQGGDLLTVRGKQILTGRRNGYNVALAKDGDMIYAVSSDLPIKRLVSLLVNRK
ncbi:MAG: zf-HC2 domain-containing protein [Deltaproteobacteria bacterium]|nr:zf-HC2 domain-containing protein [Deltaproteobacteria bacterium]MBN2672413.1 zf-HC2 domain-containing protein [Deltaproteobacteria bacterium]